MNELRYEAPDNLEAAVALQCGICTPGLLMSAQNFLEKNLDPTKAEVRCGLAGYLCHCIG